MKINEYRKINGINQLIGYSTNEFVIVIKDDKDNNPPYFTGSTQYEVCEGDSISFIITSKDDPYLPQQSNPDSTFLFWNHLPKGSSISVINPTAREKQYLFKWQTKHGDARSYPYKMAMLLKDNFCPINGVAFRNYQINVKPKPSINRDFKIKSGNLLVFQTEENQMDLIYNWKISNEEDSVIFFSTKAKDSVVLEYSGNYYIETQIINKPFLCYRKYLDTIQIQYNLNSTQVNLSNPIKVFPNPVQDKLFIQSILLIESIQIIDIYGKQVLNTAFTNEINLENLPKGYYFIRFNLKDDVINQHFIKN